MMPVLLVLEVKPDYRQILQAVLLPPTLQLLDRHVHRQVDKLTVQLIFIVILMCVSIVLQILQEQLLNLLLQMKIILHVQLVLEISIMLQELFVLLPVVVKNKNIFILILLATGSEDHTLC
jgi:hypothetical protein